MPQVPDIPADMHQPCEQAPKPTGKVARCKVCKAQWEVRSEGKTGAQGCDFCGAGKTAVMITNEKPNQKRARWPR